MLPRKKKSIYDVIYQNMDGQFFYEEETKSFILDFNEEQKRILSEGIARRYPVQAIAYPDVSAECMEVCIEFMDANSRYETINNVTAIDIWKTTRIYKAPEDCLMVLSAIQKNVNIFKEFKDVRVLEPKVLDIICYAALDDVNVCSVVRRGVTIDELNRIADKRIKMKMKWKEWLLRFRKLRNPEDF